MNKLNSLLSRSPHGFCAFSWAAACIIIGFDAAPPAFANCCLHSQTTTSSVAGASTTYPTSINSSGAVAGYYYVPPSIFRRGGQLGFVRDPDGTITAFTTPGATNVATAPVLINDAGTVAGSYGDAHNQVHGFVGNPKVAGPAWV